MIANAMQVETWTRGKKCTFSLTTADLENANDIEDLSVNLNIVDIPDSKSHGTKITLSNLVQNLSFPSPDKLRQLLLQEYGRSDDIEITVNDKKIRY